jgi:hypothetical protein
MNARITSPRNLTVIVSISTCSRVHFIRKSCLYDEQQEMKCRKSSEQVAAVGVGAVVFPAAVVLWKRNCDPSSDA